MPFVYVAQVLIATLLVGREPGRRRSDIHRREPLRDLGRKNARHVDVDAEQLRRCLHAHQIHDDRAPVAALRHKARVAEALHQLKRGTGDAVGTPAARRRLAGEPVARNRRNHHIERVLDATAVCGRVGERADDVQHLDDRARPAVDEDHRQRVLMTRLDVDEVNIEIVDLSQELRQGVQPRLDPPKVVLGAPVPHECLHRRQLHAL
jgi:hypothetical protein